MNMYQDIENTITNGWFNNHEAILTKEGKIQVLIWRDRIRFENFIKYVIDGSYMYITGDLGEAVFDFSNDIDIFTSNDLANIYRFIKTLKAFSDKIFVFNPKIAKEKLTNWKNEIRNDLFDYSNNIEKCSYDNDYNQFSIVINTLIYRASICSSRSEWSKILNIPIYKKFIQEYDRPDCKWIYGVGDVPNKKLFAYLIGLQMASKQLQNNNEL